MWSIEFLMFFLNFFFHFGGIHKNVIVDLSAKLFGPY